MGLCIGSILKRFGGALGSILIGIFWKPTFYPNHRARNPHPGDGLAPLLGPRIFRALRHGPFEGFPDGIDVEANND
jgi:hypothetical protein